MKLLEVKNLHTHFETKKGIIKAVDGVDFDLEPGKTLGIVGESGSGKSITSLSMMQLLDENGKIVEGEILFKGQDISKFTNEQMRDVRGNDIAMIFQEPMTSLNPVHKAGKQIVEAILLHQKSLSKFDAKAKAIKLLKDVGIPSPEKVYNMYPFQLSGGMRQRVMIAIALSCEPDILIADEPTTALDVTIQQQILNLMNDLKESNGTSIIFITHDLGVISDMADDVVVMYCGRVVEKASVETIFSTSQLSHPYREGLLRSIPKLDDDVVRLEVIEGAVPPPHDLPVGCAFFDRCLYGKEDCKKSVPPLVEVAPDHFIRCLYPNAKERTKNE